MPHRERKYPPVETLKKRTHDPTEHYEEIECITCSYKFRLYDGEIDALVQRYGEMYAKPKRCKRCRHKRREEREGATPKGHAQ